MIVTVSDLIAALQKQQGTKPVLVEHRGLELRIEDVSDEGDIVLIEAEYDEQR